MATIDERKQKLREAEDMLRAAQSDAERRRWTLIVQQWRELIKQRERMEGAPQFRA